MTVWPCHHGNPPVSSLGDTYSACRVQSLPDTFTLCTTRVYSGVAVCSIGMSEELLICGPLLSHALKRTLSDRSCRSWSHLKSGDESWGLMRRAAAVCYSCHSLLTAGASRRSLQLSQSPLASKPQSTPTLGPWLPPFAPVTHSRALQPLKSPKPHPSPSEHLPFCSLHQVLHCSHHSITRHSSWSSHARAFIARGLAS